MSTPVAPARTASPSWRIIITDWALDSYLCLKHAKTFSNQEYSSVIRPDVERLHGGIPSPDPKFQNAGFWGPAKSGNVVIPHGFKMKWHNLGPGKIQLRLPVMTGTAEAFLCEAYVKTNAAVDKRKMARFKTHMNLISLGQYVYRGEL